MDAETKKTIRGAMNKLGEAQQEIEALRDQQQEKFDDLSDKAKESDKGVELEEFVTELTEIAESIDEQADNLCRLTEPKD